MTSISTRWLRATQSRRELVPTRRREQPPQRQARPGTSPARRGPRRRRRPARRGAGSATSVSKMLDGRVARERALAERVEVGGAADGEQRDQHQHRDGDADRRVQQPAPPACARGRSSPPGTAARAAAARSRWPSAAARRAARRRRRRTARARSGRRRSAGIAAAIRFSPRSCRPVRDAIDRRREVQVDRVVVEREPAGAPAVEQLDDARVRAPVGLDPQLLEAVGAGEVRDPVADHRLRAASRSPARARPPARAAPRAPATRSRRACRSRVSSLFATASWTAGSAAIGATVST